MILFDTPIQVAASLEVFNEGPTTLFFGSTSAVSATANDGSVLAGGSFTPAADAWIVARPGQHTNVRFGSGGGASSAPGKIDAGGNFGTARSLSMNGQTQVLYHNVVLDQTTATLTVSGWVANRFQHLQIAGEQPAAGGKAFQVDYGLGPKPMPIQAGASDLWTVDIYWTGSKFYPFAGDGSGVSQSSLDTQLTAALAGKTDIDDPRLEDAREPTGPLWNQVYDTTTAAVTDVGYDLILLLGQSNMSGRGAEFDLTHFDPVNNRIFQYGASAPYANVLSQAAEPLSMHDVPTGMGPGLVFAREHLRRQPLHRSVLLVPCAHGGTGFEVSGNQYFWKTAYTPVGDNLYEFTIAQALAALAVAGENSRFVAALWHQGEADAKTGGATTNYPVNLDALIDGLRNRLSVADLPFVIGQLVPTGLGTDSRATINTHHIETPRRKTRAGFAYGPSTSPAGGLVNQNGDDTHYNAAGQRVLGRGMYDAFLIATANVLNVDPLPPSVITGTQSGTTANITWKRPLGRATDYKVQYRVTGAGSWTSLTRAQSIDNTAAITGLSQGTTYDIEVATVNEEGQSAWADGTMVMNTVPGQVTGLANGAPSTSVVPLTWNSIATATSYLVEYKKHADSTWLTGPTATTTSASVTQLLAGISYDFRVSALNGAGAGTVSATLTVSTDASTPLMTEVGVSASRAYSFARKLVAAYAGSAFRVRRSSDDTEQDIGFTASGDVDQAALLTFVGVNDGFVKTVYDQSGNARDVTQATAANQTQIVTAGVVNVINSRPLATFDGVNDGYTDSAPGAYAAGAATYLAVMKFTGGSTTGRLFSEGNSASANSRYVPMWFEGSIGQTLTNEITNDAGTTVKTQAATTIGQTNLRQMSRVDTGSALTLTLAGTLIQNAVAYSRPAGPVTLDRFGLGFLIRNTNSGFWKGQLAELVEWRSALSTANRQAGESNQSSYYTTS